MVVTFFGHKDITVDITEVLEKTIKDVIEKYGANMFLVGNQGGFDRLVQSVLKKVCNRYENVDYRVVLAYMPTKNSENDLSQLHQTIVFDGFELVHPKYAISKCNHWMIDKSYIVITYVTYNVGGAAKFEDVAKKKGRVIINIANFLKIISHK